jgi:flagellar biosynthesis chaperone FliJ
MSFINRLEKNITKRGKTIEKENEKLTDLKNKLNSNELTRATYNIKKGKIENKIRTLDARIRTLKGMVIKEKKIMEEKKKNSKKK